MAHNIYTITFYLYSKIKRRQFKSCILNTLNYLFSLLWAEDVMRSGCLSLSRPQTFVLEAAPPLWPSFLGGISQVRLLRAARLPKVASSSSSSSSSQHLPRSACTQTDVTRQLNTQQIMCYFPQSSPLEFFPFTSTHGLSLLRWDTHKCNRDTGLFIKHYWRFSMDHSCPLHNNDLLRDPRNCNRMLGHSYTWGNGEKRGKVRTKQGTGKF